MRKKFSSYFAYIFIHIKEKNDYFVLNLTMGTACVRTWQLMFHTCTPSCSLSQVPIGPQLLLLLSVQVESCLHLALWSPPCGHHMILSSMGVSLPGPIPRDVCVCPSPIPPCCLIRDSLPHQLYSWFPLFLGYTKGISFISSHPLRPTLLRTHLRPMVHMYVLPVFF